MKNALKKCIVIPDSFKGTLSSFEVCRIMKEQIKSLQKDCDVITIPVADGGEGTVDCFLHALKNARKIQITATGPYGEPVSCYYARHENTAIIEMAQTAGLPLVEGNLNPAKTTTYGTGEMIAHAVRNDCTEIIIGLGGSCTNDAGVGAARALGVIFYNELGHSFIPEGDTLAQIKSFDISKANQFLKKCCVTAMCDIDNPMFGKSGAAYIFAPQKGADTKMVKLLDKNLESLSNTIETCLGRDVSKIPGAGAAGAMGAGIVAFLGGSLKSGIDTVLDIVDFNELLNDTDIVFTGEGKIDSQSIRGKVVIGIAKRAKKKNIPVITVVGAIGEGAEKAYDLGVSAIFSINRTATAFEEARHHSKENLAGTMDSIIRTLCI
ncbi:MAG: glycerate kinase [Velocimicrobium sp.]